MEWVASTLILPRNVVYPALLTLMRTPRLPVVDLTDAPVDLNGLVRFGERRNLVSARVPTHFKRTILVHKVSRETLQMKQVYEILRALNCCLSHAVELVRNLVAHSDAREGK